MLSAIHALPEMYFRLREEIFEERNTLLMCTLYYICFDHGLPKSATALSKVSLNDKQLSIVRESVKTIIVNLVETSVTQGLDKKAEWTKHLHKSVNCSINSQKMPTSRWRKATKLPELVPAKYHLNLKNFSNSSEKSHSKPRSNFYSGLDGMEMAA